MRTSKSTPARLAGLLITLALAAACGGAGGGGGDGPLAGKSFGVGSKEFTEQLILGQIAIQALENAGADVEDKTGITGTVNVRKAMTAGEFDMYWEYTGTGWTTHLGHEAGNAPKDPEELYQQVAAEDLETNQVKWLEPAPMDNTYAIATARGRDAELGVSNLSEYAELAGSDPEQASLCAANEFLTRDDGWPGLQRAYDFALPKRFVSEVELGIVYTQIPEGERCNFGEVFATDGRIIANNLEIIEDDKDFFVKYNLAMTMRQEVFKENPQLANVFGPITEKLTNETMQEMNKKVDVDGMLPEQVAQEFLEQNGFIG